MLAAARRRLGPEVTLIAGCIEDMAAPDAAFDAVLALNVLYFCEPDGAMVSAMRSVLAPGGRLVAYVTDRETMQRWPFARAGFHRLYDKRTFAGIFEQGGFASSAISVQECAVGPGARGLLACARH